MGRVISSNHCLPIFAADDAEAEVVMDGCLIYVNSTNETFTSVGVWCREEGVWVKM